VFAAICRKVRREWCAPRRSRFTTRYSALRSIHRRGKTIPSWYLVSRQDHALNPDLERFYAKRMGATTSEINASHVAFISHPKVVARLIEKAATATRKSSSNRDFITANQIARCRCHTRTSARAADSAAPAQ